MLMKDHGSQYSIQPGETKMYCDLQGVYWSNSTKKDIAIFMAKCSNCQIVKGENQKLGGMLQDISIPTQKLDIEKM